MPSGQLSTAQMFSHSLGMMSGVMEWERCASGKAEKGSNFALNVFSLEYEL